MPKNLNAMLRYYRLDDYFKSPGVYCTIKELRERISDQLGDFISESTIKKDIQHMRAFFDAPIISRPMAKGYCYFYEPRDFSIKNTPLSSSDINELRSLLSMMEHFQIINNASWMTDLLVRLNNQLNPEFKLEEPNMFIPEDDGYSGNVFLHQVFSALVHKRTLQIEYEPFGKSRERFILHPHHLRQYNRRWFLFGLHEVNGNPYWNVPLDRIKTIEESNVKFRNSEVDWVAHFDQIIGVTFPVDGQASEVVLHVSEDLEPYIRTKPFHSLQKAPVRLPNGKFEVKMKLITNVELENQILQHVDHIEVLAPDSLRKRIKERLNKAVLCYGF